MTRTFSFVGTLVLAVGIAMGQAPNAVTKDAPQFDIADVHVSAKATNPQANQMSGGLMRGGLYQLRRANMLDLVSTAWGVDAEKVVGGPSWLEIDRFDVLAKTSPDVKPDAAKLMLRTLLAERFHLAVHNDTRPLPAFALTAGKKPQLKQADPDAEGDTGCKFEVQGGGPKRGGAGDAAAPQPPAIPTISYTCHKMTMAAFTEGMGGMAAAQQFIGNNLVADQTGLAGAWDFSFKYTVRGGPAAPGAETISLADAVEKQLGLKLEPATVPMPVVVVDSVDRKPTENTPEAAKAFPAAKLEFEVADVKPSAPGTQGARLNIQPGGRIDIQNLPLKFLVQQIWGLGDDMVVGAPKSMDDNHWDIVAKAPQVATPLGAAAGQNGTPIDIDTLLQMLRQLMVDRFKLVTHFEERPLSAYTLTAVKPKMKPADPASRTRCKEGPATLGKSDARDSNPILGRLLTCQNVSMAYIAEQLQYLANGYVHSAVLDSTGLEGGWDFTLSFSSIGQLRGGDGGGPGAPAATAGGASDPNGAIGLPEAIEKQLGLKLEMQKRPVQVLVIDHVEDKPTDN